MSKYTSVVSGDSLISLQNKTLLSTQKLLDSMLEGRQFFTFGDRVVNCQKIDVVRWLTELNSVELGGLALRNLIVNSVVSSEFKQGGSGVICLITLIYFLRRYSQDKALSNKTLDFKEIEKEIRNLSLLTKRTSTQDILSLITHLNSDPTSYEIFKKSVHATGGGGSIYIEKHSSPVTKIVKQSGYRFPGNIPEVFLSAAGPGSAISLPEAKVCVIDGIIERVSEINGLIHNSYKQKMPLVIVARGFNDDVQNTLGVNYNTGNLRVVPFCVPYDALGANLVNDICVVSGGDIVSSLKGDLISAIEWNDIQIVEKAVLDISSSELVIQNNKTFHGVLDHKQRIRKKFVTNRYVQGEWLHVENDMKSDVLESRLSCLMGDGVRLSIGADLQDAWGVTKDRVETQIKILKDGSKFGVIDVVESKRKIKNRDLKILLNTLKKISPILTSRSLFAGLKTGIGAAKMIGEVGGIVYFDQ